MPMKSSISSLSQNSSNTAEFIADVLRKAIFEGKYKAGQPMLQDRVAKELKVSKIPVREALIQLKSEGLVVFIHNRGAVVSELSPAEVNEIFSMRLALESLAVKKAVLNIREADLIRATSILKIIDGDKDKGTWSDLNWEFHEILYSRSKMPMLINTIKKLHFNIARYLIIYLDHLSGFEESQIEHWQILKAFEERNIETILSVLETHLRKAEENLVKFLG
jgi:DNA-binding GntR family transcriptional regulator